MNEIYLDNAATTRVHPQVAQKMMDTLVNNYGNPSSLHRLGIRSEQAIKEVRGLIAKNLNCQTQEIYFTSGGTEGNNMIIQGVVENKKRERMRIITSAIEHPSVLDVFTFYQNHQIEVVVLGVDAQGHIDLTELQAAMNEDTILVSIMGVNNELGTIQDLKAIGKIVKAVNAKCVFHADFVQGFMKIPIDVQASMLDALTLSGHKIFGPKGVGAVYLKKGTDIKPLLRGGGQENNLRSGTENVPGIVGFGEAVRLRSDSFMDEFEAIRNVRNDFINELETKIDDIKINGDPNGSPYVLNVSFNRVRGEVLLHSLESKGIFVSTGSACSSHKKEKQYVLKAIGLAEEYKEGTIRISFSKDITNDDVKTAVAAIAQAVSSLRLLIKPNKNR
ncbi:cysteine desulfurase [Acetobacterium wieringae]|uniref:Cysteine desulfurase n=1 Tax=Acetobacterium wieringae TaxID=52694 RepID=A0ABY6HBP2_9FIRM|nr:cysteine desulfurase family protein [Acetobacterium wieringae]MEA4805296.1 cysteine desulfurase family protein [Acetobacterium wieringae]URN83421.1 cysteine desulfurase [Acetobacterium wieringae]UYO61902.1 cysteine desulfurase [Acetobacterium wieringae]VUZ28074.1 Cysteine desulfurase IscS [Acetobacterium wieringae]